MYQRSCSRSIFHFYKCTENFACPSNPISLMQRKVQPAHLSGYGHPSWLDYAKSNKREAMLCFIQTQNYFDLEESPGHGIPNNLFSFVMCYFSSVNTRKKRSSICWFLRFLRETFLTLVRLTGLACQWRALDTPGVPSSLNGKDRYHQGQWLDKPNPSNLVGEALTIQGNKNPSAKKRT